MDELAGEPLRLLCSLPGIEANVISLIQQLSSYVSESRDREERVKRRVDELCAHVSELRGELSSLRQSAIAPMHVDQQQQKGEEVKESAASSTNSTPNQQLTIFSSKLISKADGKVGARVTISRASVEALTQPNFWPRPVYARPWVFRDDQRNAADKQQQEQQQKTQENQHQESTLSLEQRNTADQQQQKKRQEEHQKTQENQHQESTPEEHQHLQTEQQNLHTASSDSQCPASSDSQCPASNDSQCPASSDSQCPAPNDSQSPASNDVQQDSGQHQPKLQDTSTASAPAKATPPRPGKRHAEDSPGSMSGIPCKMQPSSSSQ
ncbi:uncharacterized protein LOC135827230 [Sycon ciliatum]|uniref:uncharacterized protein LOC135827230 n=1 Tax=Sycon ciliatum TaxID=27933 RepID=UPI0031F631C1